MEFIGLVLLLLIGIFILELPLLSLALLFFYIEWPIIGAIFLILLVSKHLSD